MIGAFNAKIGKKDDSTISSIGEFDIGARNTRSDMKLNYFQSEDLYSMNTFFKKLPHSKWTSISPDCKTKNEIDFIIYNNKKIPTDVTVINKIHTRNDHGIVRSTIIMDKYKVRKK